MTMVDDEFMRSVSKHPFFYLQFNKIIHISFNVCRMIMSRINPDQVLAQLLHEDNKLVFFAFSFYAGR